LICFFKEYVLLTVCNLKSGKTTLLNILALRKTDGGTIGGKYFIGNQAMPPTDKWSSYVMQDNVHIPLFTVS